MSYSDADRRFYVFPAVDYGAGDSSHSFQGPKEMRLIHRQDHRTHRNRPRQRAAPGFIQACDVLVIGPEIQFVCQVRVLDHTSPGVHSAESGAGRGTCAANHGRC